MSDSKQRALKDAEEISTLLVSRGYKIVRRRGGYLSWWVLRDRDCLMLSWQPRQRIWELNPHSDSPAYWEILQILLKRGSAR